MSDLVLRLSASRSKGPEYYDVLSDGEVVGCICFASFAPPLNRPWMWALADGHHCRRAPAIGPHSNVRRDLGKIENAPA
jgi:hypothetical protein